MEMSSRPVPPNDTKPALTLMKNSFLIEVPGACFLNGLGGLYPGVQGRGGRPQPQTVRSTWGTGTPCNNTKIDTFSEPTTLEFLNTANFRTNDKLHKKA